MQSPKTLAKSVGTLCFSCFILLILRPDASPFKVVSLFFSSIASEPLQTLIPEIRPSSTFTVFLSQYNLPQYSVVMKRLVILPNSFSLGLLRSQLYFWAFIFLRVCDVCEAPIRLFIQGQPGYTEETLSRKKQTNKQERKKERKRKLNNKQKDLRSILHNI